MGSVLKFSVLTVVECFEQACIVVTLAVVISNYLKYNAYHQLYNVYDYLLLIFCLPAQ